MLLDKDALKYSLLEV